MKRFFIAALLIPAGLHAQVRDSIVSASATRTTRISPDRATAFVIVEGTAETPADANARLELKLKAVNDAVKALGNRAELDRPVPFGVSLQANPNGYPMPATPTSYISRAVMRLQSNRLDQLSATIATIISSGATSVSALSFETSTIDSVRRERIVEAIATARADAQAAAAAMGGKLGALVDVVVSGQSPLNFSTSQLFLDARFGGAGQAAVPDVVLNTNVTLRYRILR